MGGLYIQDQNQDLGTFAWHFFLHSYNIVIILIVSNYLVCGDRVRACIAMYIE